MGGSLGSPDSMAMLRSTKRLFFMNSPFLSLLVTERHDIKGHRIGCKAQPLADRTLVDARNEAGPYTAGRAHEIHVLRDGPCCSVGPAQSLLAAGEKAGVSPRVGDQHEHVGGPPDKPLAREARLEAVRRGALQSVGRCVVAPGALIAHDIDVDVLVAESRR